VRSNGLKLNEKGQAVGLSELPSGESLGFLWDEASGIHSIGSLHEHSEGWDINELGHIVGETDVPNGDLHPFLWIPDEPNGATGTMYDLGSFGGDGGAWQINELGQVSGWNYRSDGFCRGFLWTPFEVNGRWGSMVDLGTLGGYESDARALNDVGQTAGQAGLPYTSFLIAFVWTPYTANGQIGEMRGLDTILGTKSIGRGINASGEVVGAAWFSDDTATRAFKWTPREPNSNGGGTMRDLGSLGGPSYAYGVNDRGEVVGRGTTATGQDTAFLWTKRDGMVDLSTRLEASFRYDPRRGKGWHISIARDINSKGWVIGTGTLDGGHPRAVLLRPIGEE
jgi:probable HAF family extracellular repeat protein